MHVGASYGYGVFWSYGRNPGRDSTRTQNAPTDRLDQNPTNL